MFISVISSAGFNLLIFAGALFYIKIKHTSFLKEKRRGALAHGGLNISKPKTIVKKTMYSLTNRYPYTAKYPTAYSRCTLCTKLSTQTMKKSLSVISCLGTVSKLHQTMFCSPSLFKVIYELSFTARYCVWHLIGGTRHNYRQRQLNDTQLIHMS